MQIVSSVMKQFAKSHSLLSEKINKKNIINVSPAELAQRVVKVNNFIRKTCLYNSDPLKPHFYIVKLGFTGVYIIFLISA